MSKNTQISELINYISVNESGNVVFTTVPAATTNTDKFLVSDAGVLKFRTAAQLLSDIGAQASGSYQAALSGTGFVKISGSTISYDNSTYATETYVGTAISNLVASSPATLDTLNELALALGSDPNFATTVATSIGTKQAQLNGTGFVKVTGTTVSYDNSTYALDSVVVKLTGSQTIAGIKTFQDDIKASSFLYIREQNASTLLANHTQVYANSTYFGFTNGAGTGSAIFTYNGAFNYTLPASAGTLAITSQLHNAVTLGTANGLSLSTQVLSLGLASSSTNGALSSTDWTTFNGKQNALTNPVTGTGTSSYIPKFTGSSAIGNSLIYDTGSIILIGATTASDNQSKLELISSSGPIGLKIKSSGANGNNTFLSIESSKEWRFVTNRGDLISGNQGDLIIRNNTDGVNHIILNQNGNTTFSGSVRSKGMSVDGTSGAGFLAQLDGNNSAANGAYIGFVNAANTRYFISQLDTNNDINYYYFNGSAWSSSIMKLSNAGAATFTSTLRVGGATGNFLIDSYTTSKIGVRSWTDTSGTTNNFFVQNSANYNYGIVGVVSASGTSTGDVYGLGYSPSAGTSMTPVLNWTSAGYVGIQNSEPQARLHIGAALINSADATNGLILKQTSTNETTGIYLERSGERKGYAIYVGGSFDSLNFQRNNAGTKSDTLTLTRDGHVGINQQNPTGLGGPSFVVAGSGYPEVIVEKTGANARKWGFTVGSDGSYLLRDYTSGANVFTVNTSGTGNFNSNITVSGNTVWHSANDGSGSGLDADLLDGRDSGGYMTQIQGGIEFAQGSYTGWYKLARSSEAVSGAGLRGSFKIIVAATGNYLTPTQDEITGFKDWTTTAVITSVVGGNGSIFQNYRITYDANYSYLEGYISYYFGGGQSIVINSYVNGLNGLTWSPYTGTAEASSTSNGAVSIGKVGTGLAVPYLRSAGGIQFGNGTSTLNYYEEGSFTPTNVGSNMAAVTVGFGKYVRIGNQVTVNARWTVSPGGTGQKYFVFHLPFAFAISSSIGYTGAVSNYNNGLSAYSSNVGTTVRNSSGSDTQQYVEAVFTTNAETTMHLSMTYFTF